MVYQQIHRIRGFNPNIDLNQVIEINRQCLPENYFPNFFLDIYKNSPNTFLVGEVNGQVVGYIMCRFEYGLSEINRLKFVRKGHIVSIAVLPQFRRMRIGFSLISKVIDEFARIGASECYLEVRETNLAGVKLYQKMNFKIVKKAPLYYHDGADANVMAIELS
jgi:ribosomal-protein-alanine N-acetyltransferase